MVTDGVCTAVEMVDRRSSCGWFLLRKVGIADRIGAVYLGAVQTMDLC